MLDIGLLKPYEGNPRKITDDAVNKVAQSISLFGFKQPIVIDKDYVIIVGHTRRLASIKLGLKEVPCLMADDLDKEKVKAYRLADNKTSELSDWDFTKLEIELQSIDFSMGDFGFNLNFDDISSDSDKSNDKVDKGDNKPKDNYYTDKIVIPNYTPTMEQPPLIGDLVNIDKVDDLIEKINNSSIDEHLRKFLNLAAYRHLKFDYHLIAEYYAHATPDIQSLFEDLALVIIDYNKAVENGFVEINKKVMESIGNKDG